MTSSPASLHQDLPAHFTSAVSETSSRPEGIGVFPCGTSKEQMLLEHLPQVRLIARAIMVRTRFHVELDDLIGYGTLGLLDAVRKFDPGRGVLLKTYAEHRIRGAILDGLRTMDWLSRAARRKARASCTCRNSPAIVHGSMGKGEGFPAIAIQGLHSCDCQGSAPRPQVHADFAEGNAGHVDRRQTDPRMLPDLICCQPTQEHIVENKQQRAALAEAIENLPERQQSVLQLYYRRELSMKQIAAVMGVHESRVSQIHLAAITRLRKMLCGAEPVRQAPGRAGSMQNRQRIAMAV